MPGPICKELECEGKAASMLELISNPTIKGDFIKQGYREKYIDLLDGFVKRGQELVSLTVPKEE